jgi:hypothetical protein
MAEFFDGWPGAPYRFGTAKWAAITFAALFFTLFVLALLFAPSEPSVSDRVVGCAKFSALTSALSTAIIWANALYLRYRKRAPLWREHRLRQRRR